MKYSKTIDKSDYEKSNLFQHIENMTAVLAGTYTSWGTEYRKWEYGMALTALRKNKAEHVMDVGGGSSMLAASMRWLDLDVVVIDPDDYNDMFERQRERIGKYFSFQQIDFSAVHNDVPFDAVTCISTIEHVQDDTAFFLKLLSHVKKNGILFLTTDFHPERLAPVHPMHLRTYNAEDMFRFVTLAQENGFKVYGEEPDYSNFEPLVYGLYSFASLALKRVK